MPHGDIYGSLQFGGNLYGPNAKAGILKANTATLARFAWLYIPAVLLVA